MSIVERRPVEYEIDHDISLVDMAAILVRRKATLAAVFLVVCVLGGLYGLMAEEKYVYSSLYRLALQEADANNPSGYLEAPQAVIEKVHTVYLPQAVQEAGLAAQEQEWSTNVSYPDQSGLIKVGTRASGDQENKVSTLHTALLQQMLIDQQRQVEHRIQQLEKRILQASNNLDELSASHNSQAYYRYAQLLTELKIRQDSIEEGGIIQVAKRSMQPVGMGSLSLVLISVLIAAVMSVMAAFTAEFLVRVRQAL